MVQMSLIKTPDRQAKRYIYIARHLVPAHLASFNQISGVYYISGEAGLALLSHPDVTVLSVRKSWGMFGETKDNFSMPDGEGYLKSQDMAN